MNICDFDESRHLGTVRECLIELQNHERQLNPRMPPGEDIVDDYIPLMLERCHQCHGKVMVAEVKGDVAGYVTILPKVKSEELEDGDAEYGLVSDLVVMGKFRGLGIGRRLLESAESYARVCGVRWLRIGVLAGNQPAESLYASLGFSNLYIELEKELTPENG